MFVVCPSCKTRCEVDGSTRKGPAKCPKCGAALEPPAGAPVMEFPCPHCGNRIKVPAKLAGRSGHCAGCKRIVKIPSAAPAAPKKPAAARRPTPAAPARPPRAAGPVFQAEVRHDDGEQVTLNCPECKTKLQCPSASRGKTDTCPMCKTTFLIPVETISFRCPECKAGLETPASLGGQKDRCPNCGKVCDVPLTKKQKEALRQREREEVRLRKAEEKEKAAALAQQAREEKARQAEAAAQAAEQPAPADEAPAAAMAAAATAPPVAPAQAAPPVPQAPPRPRAQGEARQFGDEAQWCVLAQDLTPPQLIEVCRGSRSSLSIAATVQTGPSGVALQARPLPKRYLLPRLALYPVWAAVAGVLAVLNLTGPIWYLLALFATLNPLAVGVGFIMEFPVIVVYYAILFFTNAVRCGQYLWHWVKAAICLASGRPYTFIPFGLPIKGDSIAELPPGEVTQAFRVRITHALLNKRIKQKNPGCLGVILLPVYVALGLLRLVRRVVERIRQDRYEILAFVVGEPIDMEAPSGLLDRMKRKFRERKAKKRRVVFLVHLNPGQGDEVAAAVEASLGRQLIVIDDEQASKTLWR